MDFAVPGGGSSEAARAVGTAVDWTGTTDKSDAGLIYRMLHVRTQPISYVCSNRRAAYL